MRIHKVYIEDFKNLKQFEINLEPDEMNTVLLGQNATGKSNFIEALVLIFKYLDLAEEPPQKENLQYKIEYECRERIICVDCLDGKYKFDVLSKSVDIDGKEIWISNEKKISKAEFFRNKNEYLPKYVFTYYSGISNRLKDHFDEHQKKFYDKIIKKDATRENVDELRRMFYVQIVHSYFVLMAFFAYEDEKTREFLQKYLLIDDIESILFKFQHPDWSGSKRFQENFMWGASGLVREFLDELWKLSLAPIDIEESYKESFRDKGNKKKEFLYLFIQDKNKLQELANYYKGGNTELFKALESTYISDLINEVRVRVKKKNVIGNITFKELSEGEQQLLTVLGLLKFTRDEETLILLDEPDTHLNPLWKWEYLDLLKAVVKKDTTTNKEDDTTQVILNTHDPLVIGSMDKNQVRIFRRDTDSGRIFAEQPDVSPKGLGVAGILTSELFGLPTTLDSETQDKLNEKNQLTIKQASGKLTSDEAEHLRKLSNELTELGFSRTFRDPLYQRFITALSQREEFKFKNYTNEELENQNKAALEILDELLSEGKEDNA
jgi:predicted ATP-binding protein involved in virulence